MPAPKGWWLSMGYNFGGVIASGTVFDSRGGFQGQGIRLRQPISRF